MNSKSKGDISETAIMLAFLKLGMAVSIPFGDNESYDLVVDFNGTFKSIQVKTGSFRNGCVVADLKNSINTKNVVKEKRKRESYVGKVDYIAIYCIELNKCYLINPENFGAKAYLRIDPPKNNQTKNIVWAENYKLGV